ncbi:MAG: hypothetical protein WCW17_04350 [Patescibacteria group bacterium]
MHKDKAMLIGADIDSNMCRLIKEWQPHVVGFHPEFEEQFVALSQHDPKAGYPLFPVKYPQYSRKSPDTDQIYYSDGIDIGDNFVICVIHNAEGKEIEPLSVAKKALTEIYPSSWQSHIYNGKEMIGTSRILFEEKDKSLVWPPFFSTSIHDRPWVAIRDIDNLKIRPGICPHCGQDMGKWKKIKSHNRIILAAWGAGRNFIGGGYFLGQTVYELNHEPYIDD